MMFFLKAQLEDWKRGLFGKLIYYIELGAGARQLS